MKQVTFVESATVYPDGKIPARFEVGAKAEFEDEYADLLVTKGHCVEVGGAKPSAKGQEEVHA